jgi:hypothetical protein
VKNKKLPVEEPKPKPKEPTNMEIVTSLADALKDVELCAQKHGATILNDKIVIDPNDYGLFNVFLKLSFSGHAIRLVRTEDAFKSLSDVFELGDHMTMNEPTNQAGCPGHSLR